MTRGAIAPLALLALFGAVLLTGLDAVHTHTGTTEYAHAVAFRAAWWVPLLFGGSASIGGWLYVRGYARLGGPERMPSWGELGRGLFAMSVLYASSGLLPATDMTKLAVLVTGAVVLFGALDRSRAGALLVVGGVVAGPLVEITLVRVGAFHYRAEESALAGVPIWLPALYACVTPVMGQLARRLLGLGVSLPRPSARAAPAP